MTSSYERDPQVPPARVERLGKHHATDPHGPVGLPPAQETPPEVDLQSADARYEDFLEADQAG